MKILRSRKALSPVVASIILIAVTVAVSIAVAAWMGALSFSFMGTGESLQVGTPYAWNSTSVTIKVTNTGGGIVTIEWCRVNNTQLTINYPLSAKQTADVVCNFNSTTFSLGYSYTIILITSNNKEFPTTGTYNP
jgi:flagellin-like protein